MRTGILCPYVWFCVWIDPKRYIIGGTYCIFFIYVWACLSLEEALGIDIYYIIDTQLIILFWRNFKIVFTYCIFYGISYIFRAYFVLWVHGIWVGAVCYSYGRRPAFNHSSFIGFIINTLHKANIQGNQEQGPRYPRLNGRSTWNNREEGLGFYAGSWWGWFVLREGTPPDKVNQGKSR